MIRAPSRASCAERLEAIRTTKPRTPPALLLVIQPPIDRNRCASESDGNKQPARGVEIGEQRQDRTLRLCQHLLRYFEPDGSDRRHACGANASKASGSCFAILTSKAMSSRCFDAFATDGPIVPRTPIGRAEDHQLAKAVAERRTSVDCSLVQQQLAGAETGDLGRGGVRSAPSNEFQH